MTDRHLKFLDFVLQKLNEEYEIGDDILSIAYYYKKEKEIDFPEKDIQPFSDLYEGTYFKRVSDISSIVTITPNAKEIIDTYGSLSKYFEIISESQARQQAKLNDKEQLEIELAKSNIEANKLNERVAKQNLDNETKNRKAMWINIVIGVLNALLLAWSLLKD